MSGEFSAAESRALSLAVVSLALVALACAGKPANFNQVSKQTVDQHGSSPLYLLPKSTQEEKKVFRAALGASCRSEGTLRVTSWLSSKGAFAFMSNFAFFP